MFPEDEKRGRLRLVASRGGDDDSVKINQDVSLYASILTKDEEVSHELRSGRHAWVQLISGSIELNGELLNAGDGAAVSDESRLNIKAIDNNSEFLLFDLN